MEKLKLTAKPELMLHQGTALTEVLFAHFHKNVQVLQVNHDRNGRRKKEKIVNLEFLLRSEPSHPRQMRTFLLFFFYVLFFTEKNQAMYLQTGKHTK